MLDVKKAYDVLWQDGLFYKLYKVGLLGKLWRILRCMYQDFVCKVMINGTASKSIKALRGIHQGAPCSTFLFMLFVNDLLCELQNVYPGISLRGIPLNAVAYADDITIMCSCKTDLQYLIDKCVSYGNRWHFEFSHNKSAVLIYGKNAHNNQNVTMKNTTLQSKSQEPHLGNVLAIDDNNEKQFVEARFVKCQRVCFGIQGLGSYLVPITVPVASNLYKTLCLTKLCYGSEVMSISHNTMNALESFNAKNAKIFQGLPKHTCNVGSLMTIGWYPIECHTDILRLCFLWRIMVLPISSIYKLLLIRQLAWFIQNNTLNHGPMSTMFSTSMKYGLLTHIINATFYGKCMTILQWKRIVHDKVCRHWTASLKITN